MRKVTGEPGLQIVGGVQTLFFWLLLLSFLSNKESGEGQERKQNALEMLRGMAVHDWEGTKKIGCATQATQMTININLSKHENWLLGSGLTKTMKKSRQREGD